MIINGKNYDFKAGITVSEMLEMLKVNENNVVVELNYEIIEKAVFKNVKLKEEDSIEVVSFMGGG